MSMAFPTPTTATTPYYVPEPDAVAPAPVVPPSPVSFSLPDSPTYTAVASGTPDGRGYVAVPGAGGSQLQIHRESFLRATTPETLASTRNPFIGAGIWSGKAGDSFKYSNETPLADIVRITGDRVLGDNTLGVAYTDSLFGLTKKVGPTGTNDDTGVGSPLPSPPEFVPAGADTGVVSTGPGGAAPTAIKEAVAATPGAPSVTASEEPGLVLPEGSVDDFTKSPVLEEAAKIPGADPLARKRAEVQGILANDTSDAAKMLGLRITEATDPKQLDALAGEATKLKADATVMPKFLATLGKTPENVTLEDIPRLLEATTHMGDQSQATLAGVRKLESELMAEEKKSYQDQVLAEGARAQATLAGMKSKLDPRYALKMDSEYATLTRELNTLSLDNKISARSVAEAQNKVASFEAKLNAAGTTIVDQGWLHNTDGLGRKTWNTGNVMASFSMGFGALGLLAQYDAQNKQFDLQMKQLSEEREFRERQLKMQLIAEHRRTKLETGAMVEAASVGKPSNSGADAPSRNPEVRL